MLLEGMELCPKGGDYFLILLNSNFSQLSSVSVGPYSRFGFNHPGPFVFYLYALLEPLWWWIENEFMRHSLSQFLINLSLLVVCVLGIPSSPHRSLVRMTFLVSILYLLLPARSGVLFDIWGPSSLVCPVLAFICCGAYCASGRLVYVLPWCFSAIFALSNHLSSAQIIFPCGVIALWTAGRSLGERGWLLNTKEKISMVLGAIIAAIGALPIILEALSHENFGNIGKIAAFFLKGREDSVSSMQALEYVSSFFAAPLRPLGIPSYAIALLVLAFPWWERSASLWIRTLRLTLLVSFVCAFMGALSIPGKMYQYLMMYMFSIAGIAWFLFLRALAILLDEKIPRIHFSPPLIKSVSLALLIGGLICGYAHLPLFKHSCGTKYESVVSALQPSQDTLIEFELKDLKLWGALAGMMYHLTEQQYPACVPELWSFMFGSRFTCAQVARERSELKKKRIFDLYLPVQLPHPPAHAIVGRGFTVVERYEDFKS